MKPMQVTSFVEVIAKCDIFQAAVTVISVALYFGLLREALVHDLLQGFSFEVVHNFHLDEERNPVLRLDIAATALILSVSQPRFPLWEGPPT